MIRNSGMCDRKDSNYKHFVCYQKQTILFRMILSAFDTEKTSKLAINAIYASLLPLLNLCICQSNATFQK